MGMPDGLSVTRLVEALAQLLCDGSNRSREIAAKLIRLIAEVTCMTPPMTEERLPEYLLRHSQLVALLCSRDTNNNFYYPIDHLTTNPQLSAQISSLRSSIIDAMSDFGAPPVADSSRFPRASFQVQESSYVVNSGLASQGAQAAIRAYFGFTPNLLQLRQLASLLASLAEIPLDPRIRRGRASLLDWLENRWFLLSPYLPLICLE
jgi:hypothetical protein